MKLLGSVKSGKMVSLPFIFIAILASILAFSAKSDPLQRQLITPLKFGYSEFAPYTYTNDKGIATGEISKIISRLVSESGYRFVSIPGSNRRLFRSILLNDIDLLMVVPFKNADSDRLIFGEKSFDMLDIAVFWLEGKTHAIVDINQLQSRAFIAIAGYSYGGLFRGKGALVNTERLLLETHHRALKALFLGRASYLLAYKKPVMFYVEPELKSKLSSYKYESIPLLLAIRRTYPNAEKVLQELETSYAELFPEHFQALNPE